MITLFNIGLTLLSSNVPNNVPFGVTNGLPYGKASGIRQKSSAEAIRILSLLKGKSLSNENIKRDDNGRPYFPEGGSDFNISHSKDIVAVSLVREEGLRTGCDVQQIRERVNTMQIAEQFFSAEEQKYISCNKTRFFEIWVLKECYLKLHGLSVFDMALAPSFICNDGLGGRIFAFGANVSSPVSFFLYELDGGIDRHYMLAVAVENNTPCMMQQLQPSIQWFSQNSLPARCIAEIRNKL